MNFLTYLGHLLQYAFWNPFNPVLSAIAWGASLWGLFIGVVPHTNKLRHLQQLLRKINSTWRVLILVLLILSSVIVAAYSMQNRPNRPMVILSQNGTIAGDNTTAIINFYIENIGGNPAYDIDPTVCWAPESKPQYLSSPGISVTVFYLYPGARHMLPLHFRRNDLFGNDSNRWYIYRRLEYSDAPNEGAEYTEEYWYLFDFSTRSLLELSPTQREAFQPYVDEFLAG
jgi:hypothetical protein